MTKYFDLKLPFSSTSSAIVLPGSATSLATIRELAAGNVKVFAAILNEIDFLVLTLPLNTETRGCINMKIFYCLLKIKS